MPILFADLVFITMDNTWYIDMPWPGDRYNLAMVGGSDKLLNFQCREVDGNRVGLSEMI